MTVTLRLQAVTRLLQAADEMTIRVWVHVKNRLAGYGLARIDRKTIQRCTSQLDPAVVVTFDVPRRVTVLTVV